MQGNFLITIDYLKKLALPIGMFADINWFSQNFPDGGEYQKVLNKCADEGHVNLGCWLLKSLGKTHRESCIYFTHVKDPAKIILSAGDVEFMCGADVLYIMAGGDIKSDGDLTAVNGIKAGGKIEAKGSVKSKKDIDAEKGIYVSVDVKTDMIIMSGWDILAGGNISAGCSIDAGGEIYAGGDISTLGFVCANRNIVAGQNILAGTKIEAGWYYDIFAGVNASKKEWSKRGIVTASEEPKNLLSGFWKGALKK